MKCIITNSISLGCISRSGLFEISIKIKSKHLWKAMKVPDDCQWAGTVNWLIKCFLCSKVMEDNQRNVRRSRNFNQFVIQLLPKIWAWNEWQQSSSPSADSWKEELLVHSHRLASMRTVRCRLFRKHYHWPENMNLWLQSWNKGPVIGLKTPSSQ